MLNRLLDEVSGDALRPLTDWRADRAARPVFGSPCGAPVVGGLDLGDRPRSWSAAVGDLAQRGRVRGAGQFAPGIPDMAPRKSASDRGAGRHLYRRRWSESGRANRVAEGFEGPAVPRRLAGRDDRPGIGGDPASRSYLRQVPAGRIYRMR